MKTSLTSACRHCRYYTPEGRRGGVCQQLNVPVQSGWAACALAIPPFAPCWEEIEEVVLSQQHAANLRGAIPLTTSEIKPHETARPALAEISAQVARL
ncbi:MAG TPA: hypothetical protein VK211_18030 [Kamptonema sp.]|nr:hypothetical protein [Kamptonema sp.]